MSEEQSVADVLKSFPAFGKHIDEEYRSTLDELSVLQVNVGYKCNIACRHCHYECSPARTEEMGRDVMEACLDAYDRGGFTTLDITGGAPEMNPDLEWLLDAAHERGANIVCRTNLCILTEPEYEHFVQKYADVDATLFASLPYYSARNNDKIRGDGVFMKNIEALRRLNAVGYGEKRTITLVFNPAGPTLPPDSVALENEYHRRLEEDFGVYFTNLVAITNAPAGRFATALNRKGRLGGYMQKLIDAFNPDTVEAMMCRSQVSVDWQGKLYDCDFNQAIHLPIISGETIFDWAKKAPERRKIKFGNWCYCCTAGAGSS